MGMRRHPRGDFAFVGVTPTQADVAYQPAAILNRRERRSDCSCRQGPTDNRITCENIYIRHSAT